MSMRSDVINFVRSHPGNPPSVIARSLNQYVRGAVTSQLSKLVLEGVLTRGYDGVSNRYYCPDPQSKEAMKSVELAEDLEARKLWNRAAGAWLDAMTLAHTEKEAAKYARRREKAIWNANQRCKSGDGWYLAGNFVGGK